MPQKGNPSKVQIMLIDKSGEREIFNGIKTPGTEVDLSVPYGGPAKIRIFVDGVLVEEKLKS